MTEKHSMRCTSTTETWRCKCGWSQEGIQSPRGLSAVDELHRAARHARHHTVLVRYPRAFDHAVTVTVTAERWTCSCDWSAEIVPGTIRDHHRQVAVKAASERTSAADNVAPIAPPRPAASTRSNSSRTVPERKGRAGSPTLGRSPKPGQQTRTSLWPNHRLQQIGAVEKWHCSCGWFSQLAAIQKPLGAVLPPKGHLVKRLGKIHANALAQRSSGIGDDPQHHVTMSLGERWKCTCGWADTVAPGTQKQAHDLASRKVNGFATREGPQHALKSMSPTRWRCSCGWIGAASTERQAEESHTRSQERERQAQAARTLREAEAGARKQVARTFPPKTSTAAPTKPPKQRPVPGATKQSATSRGGGGVPITKRSRTVEPRSLGHFPNQRQMCPACGTSVYNCDCG